VRPRSEDVDALSFGDELAELRAAAGLSYSELARRANVSATYLKDLTYGRRGHSWPSVDVVSNIAAALGVPPDRFRLVRARAVLAEPEAIDRAYANLRRRRR
jgi:transcriptional regulator with XRE-family HTH domain